MTHLEAMGDNITLNNGLTLGGMFQEKEKLIQQLEEENSCLRIEKAHLTAENQTVLQEQAQTISHLNQQLRLLTSEHTKHLSTVEILEAVKMEKNFLEEDSKIQEDERRKQKERICELEETITICTKENSNLSAELTKKSLDLQEETSENYTLSCLVGERDITIEQCRANLTRVTSDLETLKHALASKDTKLRNVMDERNHAQWKLQDFIKLNPKKKSNSSSNIPVTPPHVAKKKSFSSCDHSISPTTVTANSHLTPEKEENTSILCHTHIPAPPPSSPPHQPQLQSQPVSTIMTSIEDKVIAFDLKEKHYLSLIFRLRSELAKIKKDNKEEEGVNLAHQERTNTQRLPLQSNFVRKTVKPLKRKV